MTVLVALGDIFGVAESASIVTVGISIKEFPWDTSTFSATSLVRISLAGTSELVPKNRHPTQPNTITKPRSANNFQPRRRIFLPSLDIMRRPSERML